MSVRLLGTAVAAASKAIFRCARLGGGLCCALQICELKDESFLDWTIGDLTPGVKESSDFTSTRRNPRQSVPDKFHPY